MKEIMHSVVIPPITFSMTGIQEPVVVEYIVLNEVTPNGNHLSDFTKRFVVEYDYEFAGVIYKLHTSLDGGNGKVTRDAVDDRYRLWKAWVEDQPSEDKQSLDVGATRDNA